MGSDLLEELVERIDIVDYISQFVELEAVSYTHLVLRRGQKNLKRRLEILNFSGV